MVSNALATIVEAFKCLFSPHPLIQWERRKEKVGNIDHQEVGRDRD